MVAVLKTAAYRTFFTASGALLNYRTNRRKQIC